MDKEINHPTPDGKTLDEASAPLISVYGQLRAIAKAMMAGERPGHTLQATDLVHEAVVRLARRDDIPHNDRARWLAAAADEMRRVLIDRARMRNAQKRRPQGVRCSLDTASLKSLIQSADSGVILALEDAFLRLIDVQPRAADVVRLRFYLGLSIDETSEALGLSRRTVLRDWEFARAFLAAEIGDVQLG